MSSSVASSWIFVAITIQPSILRTATAFWRVFASVPADGFFVSVGEALPFLICTSLVAGGTLSTSISVAMIAVKMICEEMCSVAEAEVKK